MNTEIFNLDICPQRNLARRIAGGWLRTATPAIASLGLLSSGVAQSQPSAPSFTVDSIADNETLDGNCTLREAINRVNGTVSADCPAGTSGSYLPEILFDASISGQTITLGGTQLPEIRSDLSIVGPEAGLATSMTIDANGQSRIMSTYGDGYNSGTPLRLQLHNLTLTNGRTTLADAGVDRPGAAIFAYDTNLTLRDCLVTGNAAHGNGGGINVRGYFNGRSHFPVSAALTRSVVSDNQTTTTYSSPGGGIYSTGAVYLTDSVVSDNSTIGEEAHGGGVYTKDNLNLNRTVLSGNTTSGDDARGGGAYAKGLFDLYDSVITHNSTLGAQSHGGGVFWRRDDSAFTSLLASNSIITGNSVQGANADGGGLYVRGSRDGGSDLRMTSTTVAENVATGRGGGLFSEYTDTYSYLRSSTFSDNSANDGGGIFATTSNLSIENTTISGNTAAQGAGLCTTLSGSVVVNHSTVTLNTASGMGINPANDIAGGVNQDGGSLYIANSIVANNTPADCSFNGGNYNSFIGARSLDQDGTCATITGGGFTTSNSINLDVLSLNGGRTASHGLLAGSSAIDQISSTDNTLRTDQRGVERPSYDSGPGRPTLIIGSGATSNNQTGSLNDIGAVEYNDNGVFGFTQVAFAELENNGPETISVRRSDGTNGAVSVNVTVRSQFFDRATAMIDYDVPGATFDEDDDGYDLTLNWADGEGGIKSFNVDLVNDNVNEGLLPETTSVSLRSASGGASIGNFLVKLGIIDPSDEAAVNEFFGGDSTDSFSFGGGGATGLMELLLLLPLALLGLGRKLRAVMKGRR